MEHNTSTINIITERRSNGEYLGLHTAPKTHFHLSTSPQNHHPSMFAEASSGRHEYQTRVALANLCVARIFAAAPRIFPDSLPEAISVRRGNSINVHK